MKSINVLTKKLSDYLSSKEVKQVVKAYDYAKKAHLGQFRKSGEPYVSHPLAVANILSSFKMDQDTISAALLHDVLEDTNSTKLGIKKEFNLNVANLVDGVSKLDQLDINSTTEMQAENFQKMVLAMSKDIRVIVLKLADRLHNMRTINYLDREKQVAIAKETLEIYGNLAHRIGMNNVYRELEDLAFKTIYPTRYSLLSSSIKKNRGGKSGSLKKIQRKLQKKFLEQGIPAYIEGREKHVYSIYRKMKERNRSFQEIMDVYAFKVIVDSPENCYKAIGSVHSLYKPIEGRFKDYIAMPKSNGYQSVHTGVIGDNGQSIEVQIKTEDMNEVAENGIASHWIYKSGKNTSIDPQNKARRWVAGLLEMRENFDNSHDFIESIKTDIFPDEIYVFTPQGEIIEMSSGSTPVDFAFAVHTDIGLHCKACRINRKFAPLSISLENGQTVEIITDSLPQTSPTWLNFVKTSRARNRIRNYLSNLKTSEARILGKRFLDQHLLSLNLDLKKIDKKDLRNALDAIGTRSLNLLLEEIGLGKRVGNIVANQISGYLSKDKLNKKNKLIPLEITGSEGLVVNYATCCRPIPGDSVIGHFTAERGLVVHQERCKNILAVRKDPSQCFPINWHDDLNNFFSTKIKILTKDEPGVLATISTTIANMETNIDSLQVSPESGSGTSDFIFGVQVKGRDHLARLLRSLRSMPLVLSAKRLHDQENRHEERLH